MDRRINILLVAVAAIFVMPTFAQTAVMRNGRSEAAMYDPIFWRKELHLNQAQYQRIKAAGSQFYQNLLTSYRDSGKSREAFHSYFDQCRATWQADVEHVMKPRQRKKWRKIVAENQPRA